ncbi:hypothetical protein ACFL0L_01995 [Patescibacteria group bacterium]
MKKIVFIVTCLIVLSGILYLPAYEALSHQKMTMSTESSCEGPECPVEPSCLLHCLSAASTSQSENQGIMTNVLVVMIMATIAVMMILRNIITLSTTTRYIHLFNFEKIALRE